MAFLHETTNIDVDFRAGTCLGFKTKPFFRVNRVTEANHDFSQGLENLSWFKSGLNLWVGSEFTLFVFVMSVAYVCQFDWPELDMRKG